MSIPFDQIILNSFQCVTGQLNSFNCPLRLLMARFESSPLFSADDSREIYVLNKNAQQKRDPGHVPDNHLKVDVFKSHLSNLFGVQGF